MNVLLRFFGSSLGKKIIVALTGVVLVLFVTGHMAGNLLVYGDPSLINGYAHKLQTLPYGLLWIVRLVLLTCVTLHIIFTVKLKVENLKARPNGYEKEDNIQSSLGSRTMIWTGSVLAAFIIFHILHFTVKNLEDYSSLTIMLNGELVPNVHAMIIKGFSHISVSVFYIIAVGLLSLHLSHGASSMFQSLGLRNQFWRPVLERTARIYSTILFLGFASIPFCVLTGILKLPGL